MTKKVLLTFFVFEGIAFAGVFFLRGLISLQEIFSGAVMVGLIVAISVAPFVFFAFKMATVAARRLFFRMFPGALGRCSKGPLTRGGLPWLP